MKIPALMFGFGALYFALTVYCAYIGDYGRAILISIPTNVFLTVGLVVIYVDRKLKKPQQD
ncbi:hypothetical protein H5P28_07505 [Ruficoccus amylovorans]|uniref:Uncharacterized protein n=1 Tax=Ruficoccus amylovorans TaxID=1804625 RepID=A0A842HEV7_9BACT|nr:hypothetical protein [Ruficoccus amylovorans]MBC2594107.1 hypothetical protein [Ruficoccus amylovorans]